MTTVTIKISVEQAKQLKKVDVNDLFQQFVVDYLEHEQDKKLKKNIVSDKELAILTRRIAAVL